MCLQKTVLSQVWLHAGFQVEDGARILDSHCIKWDTAGKTVAIYFGQPVVNLREALLDDAILPIEMGDGAARVAPEFRRQ
jgi:hypothetical protein